MRALYGRNHRRTRSFLRILAELYGYQERDELAESVYRDALQRGLPDSDDSFLDDVSIKVLWSLARFYGWRGDFGQSELHWYESLSATIRGYGPSNEKTLYCIVRLEGSFRAQDQDPEPWLWEHFAISSDEGEAQ